MFNHIHLSHYFYQFSGLNEIHCIVIMLFVSGGNSQNVRIEYNIGRVEADFVDEDIIRSFADLKLAVLISRLSGLIERHHNDSSAVLFQDRRLLHKVLFALYIMN